jgi:hypothetical protein
MKTLSGRDLARLVERHGWTLLRINGSLIFTAKPQYCSFINSYSWQPAIKNRTFTESAKGSADFGK